MLTDRDTAKGVGLVALQGGGELANPHTVRWDIGGRCLDPPRYSIEGRGRDPHLSAQRPNAVPLFIDIDVRCRRCSECLKWRAFHWVSRSRKECERAPRTWFGTLTLTPDWHYRAALSASLIEPRFFGLPEAEQFRLRHGVCSAEITRMLKRLRKVTGAPLRYLLVAEKHKSGLPHYHMLVHEVDTDRPVSYRALRGSWVWGFSKFNLVEGPKAAHYACKYLSKDADARVRASVGYGTFTYPVRSVPIANEVPRDENPPLTPHGQARRAQARRPVMETDQGETK